MSQWVLSGEAIGGGQLSRAVALELNTLPTKFVNIYYLCKLCLPLFDIIGAITDKTFINKQTWRSSDKNNNNNIIIIEMIIIILTCTG